MKVLRWATKSKLGLQTFENEIDFYEHMKDLHDQGVAFCPFVLVDTGPKWIKLGEYRKLEKKEETA